MALVAVLCSACAHIGFARADALPRVLTCSRCDREQRFESRPPRNGSLSARMLFGESRVRLQKGLVYEGRIVQKRAGFRMDVLLLSIIDYSCRVQAISLHEHESRRCGVLDSY